MRPSPNEAMIATVGQNQFIAISTYSNAGEMLKFTGY
jgi:hypothetical protein